MLAYRHGADSDSYRQVSLALTFVVGLIFGVAQVRAAARDRRERLTLETLRVFKRREFAELMDFIIHRAFLKSSEEARALNSSTTSCCCNFPNRWSRSAYLFARRLNRH